MDGHTRDPARRYSDSTTSADQKRHLRRLPLRTNIAFTFLSNIVYAGAQWGLLIVLARYGSPSLVGQYVYCLAIAAPIFMCMGLRLRSLQSTDIHNSYLFGHYLATSLVGNAAALAIATALSFLLTSTRELQIVLALIAMTKVVDGISDTFYGLFQKKERMDFVAVSRTAHGVAQLAGFSIGFYFARTLTFAILTQLLSRCLVAFALDTYLLIACERTPGPRSATAASRLDCLAAKLPVWDRKQLLSLSRLSAPLAGGILLASLMSNCPKYFLAYTEGELALGVFGTLAALLTAGATITTAVNQASATRFASLYLMDRRNEFYRLLSQIILLYVGIAATGAATAYWHGELLLELVFGVDFAPYSDVLAIVLAAGCVNYTAGVVDTVLLSIRQTRLLPWLAVASAICTLGACTLLIPNFGLPGAAIALAIGKAPTLAIGLYAIFRRAAFPAGPAEMDRLLSGDQLIHHPPHTPSLDDSASGPQPDLHSQPYLQASRRAAVPT